MIRDYITPLSRSELEERFIQSKDLIGKFVEQIGEEEVGKALIESLVQANNDVQSFKLDDGKMPPISIPKDRNLDEYSWKSLVFYLASMGLSGWLIHSGVEAPEGEGLGDGC